ncbi:MAG: hypothetical protein ABI640_17615 [Gammaproteobacteria bacterium]
MSTVPAEYAVRRSLRLSFYFWIAFVMALYVFGGFSLAALQRYLLADPRVRPATVHLHGVTFIAWMTLLVLQAWLINVKNVALHRSLGTFGIALGTGVLFTGSLITVVGMGHANPRGPFFYDLMYLSLMAIAGFGFLFTLAIRSVRDPENHRRLILFATIPLLPPGINRTYQVLGQLDYLPVLATYLTMAAIAAAIVIHDWRTHGKLTFASKIGGALVFGQMLLHFPITRSHAFAEVASFVQSLARYP